MNFIAPPQMQCQALAASFPGEHRVYVEKVARALLPAFGGEQGKARIFYDAWHESKVIGYGSNRKLQKIYAEDSDLIVPFYCQDYLNKDWCDVELRAIEDLLFSQKYERVLPFRFDKVDIPSSFKTDIFPVVTDRSPEDIARLILERYNEIQKTSLKLPVSSGGPDENGSRRAQHKSTASGALAVWEEKLAFLQEEEAKAADPAQKFSLRKSIEEAKAKTRELGGHA